MDSVTQAVLGASVGHAVAGKTAGRAAMVAGAVGGTIPDLDVIFAPLLDTVSQLGFHRGISHSFAFAVLAAPVFGLVARRLAPDSAIPMSTWTLVGLSALITHIVLDSITVYGTGLFEPFSRARPAYPMVFIIDPLYTLPMVVGLIAALKVGADKTSSIRRSRLGLLISCLYLVWAGMAKILADRAFEERFAAMGIPDVEYISMPTPVNTILWRALAKVDEGTYETYYSIVADHEASTPQLTPRRDSLLAPVRGTRAMAAATWFSRGYYTVTAPDGNPRLHDLRFGRSSLDSGAFMLTLAFSDHGESDEPGLEQRWGWPDGPTSVLDEVWSRALQGG